MKDLSKTRMIILSKTRIYLKLLENRMIIYICYISWLVFIATFLSCIILLGMLFNAFGKFSWEMGM